MTGFDHPEKAPRTLDAVTVALTAAVGDADELPLRYVTNWVAGMVESHKPRWDGNSACASSSSRRPLRPGRWCRCARRPGLTRSVEMVALAVVRMAVVVRADHGGLVTGGRVPDPRPRAVLVSVDGRAVAHDVVVGPPGGS